MTPEMSQVLPLTVKTLCRACKKPLSKVEVASTAMATAGALSFLEKGVPLLYCGDGGCRMGFIFVNGGVVPTEGATETKQAGM